MVDNPLAYLTAYTLFPTANWTLILYTEGGVNRFTLSYSESRFSSSPRGWVIFVLSNQREFCASLPMMGLRVESESHSVGLFANPWTYTVHGILQARILECVAFPFSRGSSQPRNPTPCHFCQNNKGKFAQTERL